MPSSHAFSFDTPTNPWIVVHNLGDSSPFWVTYSDSGEVIFPTSVVADDANTLRFTFDQPITGSGAVLSILLFSATGATNAFTNVNAVKLFLGLDATETDQDLAIAVTIAAATESMKRFLDREILQQTYQDELHDGEGRTTIFLNEYPVTTASGIVVRNAGAAVSGTDYVVKAQSGIVQLKSGTFSQELCGVSVDYVAGFSEVPDDLNHACVKQVVYELGRQGTNNLTLGLKSSTIVGVLAETYLTDEWAPGVKGTLLRYLRVEI